MKYIGAHVSASGGVQNAPGNAEAIGANAMAIFTKSQRQWKAKPLEEKNITQFKANLAECGIKPEHVLVHDSYLINIGNPEPEKREKSLNALVDEALRVEQLGLTLLNIHPGSHLKQISEEECLDHIAAGVNFVLSKTESAVIVLETTAGQGSNMGHRFEHLAYIIDRVEQKERVGVCIDSCHIFAAGYDLRTKEAYDKTMADFDRVIGFNYLKGMHLNDSKQPFESRKDRHHSLGEGLIGLDAFKFIMEDPRLDDMPLILETIDDTIWKDEVELLRSYCK